MPLLNYFALLRRAQCSIAAGNLLRGDGKVALTIAATAGMVRLPGFTFYLFSELYREDLANSSHETHDVLLLLSSANAAEPVISARNHSQLRS
jgi:hypothetical protein